MPSPFPGMDPWLEDVNVFPDLHDSLTYLIRETMNLAMPPGYVAGIKNRVWVDDDTTREPDVGVFHPYRRSRDEGGVATLPGMQAVLRPITSDPWEEPYLEIFSADGQRLVTAVEVISRANKAAGEKGRTSYKLKQKEYEQAGVSLVEIDLLRTGPHVTAVSRPELLRTAGPFDYHVSVRVGWSGQDFAAPIRLKDRLPTISIPLDSHVPVVQIELQPLLDRAYDTGRYSARIHYDQACSPPLNPDQQSWANAILYSKGQLKTHA